jgi:hypothetical protein
VTDQDDAARILLFRVGGTMAGQFRAVRPDEVPALQPDIARLVAELTDHGREALDDAEFLDELEDVLEHVDRTAGTRPIRDVGTDAAALAVREILSRAHAVAADLAAENNG